MSVGTTAVVERFPSGVARAAASLPASDGWFYTGPMENWTRAMARVSKLAPLLGNPPALVRKVRNPWRVAERLRSWGLPCLAVRDSRGGQQHPASWVFKPFRSGGGMGLAPWDESFLHLRRTKRRSRGFLQQFVAGPSVGAIFVATGRQSRLLGITRQLIGAEWCGCSGFLYAGSIGPITVTHEQRQELVEIGNCLASEFQLRGLFCVDAILHQGRAWPVEINPRYSSSVEILERAYQTPLLGLHVEACLFDRLPTTDAPAAPRQLHGKAILYASHDIAAPPIRARPSSWSAPIGDIPQPGTLIRKGHPILTVFANGDTDRNVESRLRVSVARWRRELAAHRTTARLAKSSEG